jgi:hypothetical protein
LVKFLIEYSARLIGLFLRWEDQAVTDVGVHNAPLVGWMWFHLEVLGHGRNLRPSASDNLYNIAQAQLTKCYELLQR